MWNAKSEKERNEKKPENIRRPHVNGVTKLLKEKNVRKK